MLEKVIHRMAYPVGGFGNHLRWLAIMSPEYQLSFVSDKSHFIKNKIYPKGRDPFNYMEYELNYKFKLNKLFQITNYISEFKQEEDYSFKTILVNTSPKLAEKHYFKFHPLWNGNPWKKSDRQAFYEKTCNINSNHVNYIENSNEKILRLDSNILNSDVLDKDFYITLVNFLGISDVYSLANDVHKLWYNLNVEMEKHVLIFFKSSKFPNFPWTTYKDKYSNTKIYTEEDWNNMKAVALELYGGVN